ncbi:MAG TPA: hypothetical protein VJ946_10140, partial [Bacteroidales bacterium]|nr:hypothetical protein [Bacteroidales bacterium]
YVASRYFPIKYPFVRIFVFYTSGVGASLLVTTFAFQPPIWLKFLAMLLVMGCAFLFKLLKWADVRMVWSRISGRET